MKPSLPCGAAPAPAARRAPPIPIAATIAALVLLFGCHRQEPPTSKPPPPSHPVQLAPASQEGWTISEDVVGTIRPRLRAVLAAKVPGRVESLPVVPGQLVQKGDLVASLDDHETRARLESARASAEQASRDRDRIRRLVQQGAATPAEGDAAEARHRVAAAAVAEAETLLGHTRITAPFNGIITRKHVDVGDLASPGRPVVDIEDATHLRMEADVPEALVQGVAVGMKLPVHAATAPGALEAIVAEVAPVAESGSRTHVVKLDLPQRPDLRSGQFARLAIPAGSAAILHVPASALILRGQLEYVMVAEDGVARLRLVRSGRRQGGRISITSGLNPGEKVVVAGLDGLRDGQPLEVRP